MFLVHIRRHCGWHQAHAAGDNFQEAAIAAVIATCKQFGLDVAQVPHTVSYQDDDKGYQSVAFYEASTRPTFTGIQYVGDLWFADQVREGHPDDCSYCGGTGVNFYNPFKQCWACGIKDESGRGSGKKIAGAVAAP